MIGPRDNGSLWIENGNSNPESLVGNVQFFAKKTPTTLKGRTLVAYHGHGMLLDVFFKRIQPFIDNGQTPVRFLPGCCTQEQLKEEKRVQDVDLSVYRYISSITALLGSVVGVTADVASRERIIGVLLEAIKK